MEVVFLLHLLKPKLFFIIPLHHTLKKTVEDPCRFFEGICFFLVKGTNGFPVSIVSGDLFGKYEGNSFLTECFFLGAAG